MLFDNEDIVRILIIVGIAICMYVVLLVLKRKSVYSNLPEEQNVMEGKTVTFIEDEKDILNADGVHGHLVAVRETKPRRNIYDIFFKRIIDIVLSFLGLIILLPVYVCIAIAIKIDDPGPVFFAQKRVGKNKQYFMLHKFRSMKMATPHDVPTHMLGNPQQYITKVGKVLRKFSLDELPQVWDIFIGNMSIIGPRPALWNQDLLVAERDKYGANDVKPGLTGWAQINGRDEIDIETKAKLDGEYVKRESLFFDIKCFLKTVLSVLKHDGVAEGGISNNNMMKRCYTDGKSKEEIIGNIGLKEQVVLDRDTKKRVLIAGANSYIGESFKKYVSEKYSDNFEINVVDMEDGCWKNGCFSSYDVVLHVAGLAHVDVEKISDEKKAKYYEVNTDLAIEVAKKAKQEGVKQFVFLSSMIIYGGVVKYGYKNVITKDTMPMPDNFYGDSKLQADVGVRELQDDKFNVSVLRLPMIYGKGSKGNYPTLVKLAKKLPVLPDVENERSMLHIDNLCEFLCLIMLADIGGVFFPQNREYTKTSYMMNEIAKIYNGKSKTSKVFKPVVWFASKLPGKLGGLVNKAFGSMVYEQELSQYQGIDYRVLSLSESIKKTEQ